MKPNSPNSNKNYYLEIIESLYTKGKTDIFLSFLKPVHNHLGKNMKFTLDKAIESAQHILENNIPEKNSDNILIFTSVNIRYIPGGNITDIIINKNYKNCFKGKNNNDVYHKSPPRPSIIYNDEINECLLQEIKNKYFD